MKSNFYVKIFNEDCEDLLSDWKEIENENNFTLFQSTSWFKSWHENIYDKKKHILRIYCFYNNKTKKPELIFPLTIKKKFNLKICEFFNQNLSDYNYMIVKKNCSLNMLDVWNTLQNDLKKYCDLIHFERLPDEINFIKNDLKIFNNKKIKKNSYLNCLGEENVKISRLQKKLPSNLKRKERNLNKTGDFYYKNIKDLNYNDFMKNLFDLKIAQYKRTGARNIFNEKIISFYMYFFKNNFEIKPFFSALVDKKTAKIIAGTFSFIYRDTFFWLFPVYDINYKKFSPGLIYLKYLFNDLDENYKISLFDFGSGDEKYKLSLSNRKIFLYDYYKGFNILGIAFILIYKIYSFFKNNSFSRPILMKLHSIIRK